ncbi:MAG: HEAT repeat domain-containing protein, partial [Planctomycetes bacterium]|nr:HEAT repeat domain-containing protein [Planctomycetota bacterium]
RSGRVLAVPGVREALLDIVREGKTYGERYWAIHALSHATGDTEVYDCFYQVFRNPSGDRPRLLARMALGALCDVRPEAAADVIVEALDGPDLQLRGAAAWEAVRRGVLPSVEACLKAFVTGVNWWGRVCAGNLVSKHGEKGERVLRELMATGSDAERATAAMALARTGAKEAFDVLKEELLSGQHDRHWVEAVSQTLASRYGQQLFDWIEGQGRALASMPVVTWTLAKSRATSAGPMIGELFREGTPAVRAGAVRILARRRGPAFLPELRRCLREGPRKVAQEAFWQIHRLGQAAMPTVEAMLASDHWTERKAAVCLLRRWGKLTLKLKARAESDSHVAVRHAANWHPVIAMHHE